MNTSLSLNPRELNPREFTEFCRQTDARSAQASEVGPVSGDVLRRGEDTSAGYQRGLICDYWLAALKFYGTGRTAADLRAEAADPAWTAGLAYIDGVTPEQEREQITGIADAIDSLAAAGLTPEQAYSLAGLEELLGRPFSQFDPDANRGYVPAQRTAPEANSHG